MACVVNSYASELQAIVNEPIYNGNSYFILLIKVPLLGKPLPITSYKSKGMFSNTVFFVFLFFFSCERYIGLPENCVLITDFANPCCKKPRCDTSVTTVMTNAPSSTLAPTPPPPGQTVAPTTAGPYSKWTILALQQSFSTRFTLTICI